MKSLKKVLDKPRFTTDATATQLNYDATNRAVVVGRDDAKSGCYIGNVCETSKGKNIFDSSVWINDGFPSVIGVFGMRGTGKSFDLGVFAEGLTRSAQVSAGTSSPPAIVILDVQNQFWTLSITPSPEAENTQIEMLKKWNLKPAGVENVFCWSPAGVASNIPESREYRISPDQLTQSDWLALLEQDRYSAMGQALLELIAHVQDKTPKNLAQRAKPGGILSSFQQSTIDGLRWRLDSISETDLISQPGVDIDDLLVPGRVSVVLLRHLPDSLRALTAAILVRLLGARMTKFHQQNKMARHGKMPPSAEKLPQQLWVMMDEAHVIAPQEGKTPANAPLVDYVKRGRDSGLSLIFATQQPSAVDDKLMSQVDITFTHALGFESDVQAAVARMPTRKPTRYKCGGEAMQNPGDLIRSLKSGQAIIADAANQRPFVVTIRPRLSVHGGDTPT